MFFEVARLVLGDEVVQCSGQEGEEAIVFASNGVCQCPISQRHEVLKVDIESGEIVDA